MTFYGQATKMLAFLKQFKTHIDQMETEFEHALISSQKMNGMLATYEGALIESYGQNLRNKSARASMQLFESDDHYMIFDAVQNADTRNDLDELPARMQNPFSNMRRWLKFELSDLKAILQAIEKKNEMDKRARETQKKLEQDKTQLFNMQQGKESLRTFFMSKDSKISKITELTNRIANIEKDIECFGLLQKIIVLQLNQAAI